MSVKTLAIELYKAQQKVSGLVSELENPAAPDKAKIEEELRIARAELKLYRKMLDGEKAQAPTNVVPASYGYKHWS